MKISRNVIAALALALLILGAGPVAAQRSEAVESGSLEDLKNDLLILGQDLKLTASEAGDLLAQWLSEAGTGLGNKAAAATVQSKVGVVLETNKDNLTVILLGTDGKTTTFVATEETPIMIQDPATGLQSPFAGGKKAKFKNIKKGSWLNCSFNLKDFIQSRLPGTSSTAIPLQAVDILK